MLSIIICSINDQLLAEVRKNIAKTVGVEYELLVWNNKEAQAGLCEIYNKMAAQANYPYLCFCHEDILFETENWGQALFKIFDSKASISLIGVAGSVYKSASFSGWYTGIEGIDFFKIIHSVNGKEMELTGPSSKKFAIKKVACIDGVFMVCRRSVWSSVKFNEENLIGFHFYDIDFSLRVALQSEVIVTDEIIIRHITQGGDYGDKWVTEAFRFHKTMETVLPYTVEDKHLYGDIELQIAKNWLDRLKAEKISYKNRSEWIIMQKLYKRASLFYAIVKFLLYKPFGLQKVHQLFKGNRL